MILVNLHCTNVGLESVHGPSLLLVQNTYGAPGVGIGLRLVDGVTTSYECLVNFAQACKTSSQKVQSLSMILLGIALNTSLKILYGRMQSIISFTQSLNTMKHPSQLSKNISLQIIRQIRLFEQLLIEF